MKRTKKAWYHPYPLPTIHEIHGAVFCRHCGAWLWKCAEPPPFFTKLPRTKRSKKR